MNVRTVGPGRVRDGQGGQAIAEFAIAFPVLLMIVLGVIQISLFFAARSVVEYAAFAAARAELVGEDPKQAAATVCSSIAGPSYDPQQGRTLTVPGWGVLPRSQSAWNNTDVTVLDPGGDGNGVITVEVKHYYELVVPFVSLIFTPISEQFQPGHVPAGIFVTKDNAPHIILTSRYTRSVPWEVELQQGPDGHQPIP